jgi:hypothetical protein
MNNNITSTDPANIDLTYQDLLDSGISIREFGRACGVATALLWKKRGIPKNHQATCRKKIADARQSAKAGITAENITIPHIKNSGFTLDEFAERLGIPSIRNFCVVVPDELKADCARICNLRPSEDRSTWAPGEAELADAKLAEVNAAKAKVAAKKRAETKRLKGVKHDEQVKETAPQGQVEEQRVVSDKPDKEAIKVCLTIFRSKTNLSKEFWVADGELNKKPTSPMYSGVATRVELEFPDELADFMQSADSKTAAAYGVLGDELPDEVEIVTRDKEDLSKFQVARIKDNFQFADGHGVILLDFDYSEYGPELDVETALKILAEVHPATNQAARFIRGSVSSGVHLEGEEPKANGSLHIYMVADNAKDIPRYGKVLSDRLKLAGHGYIALAKDGSLLERTLIDGVVFSGERLDFVGMPVIRGPGVAYTPPECIRYVGCALDTSTLPDLSDEEMEQVAKRKAADKAAMAEKSAAKRAEWEEGKVIEMVAKGATPDEAVVNIAAMGTGAIQDLYGDYVLYFAGMDPVTVKEVLANVHSYDGKALADPIEGPSYGTTTAKFYPNKKEMAPVINSNAHGGRQYFLHINNMGFGANSGLSIEEQQANAKKMFDDLGKSEGAITTGDRPQGSKDKPWSIFDFSLTGDIDELKRELRESRYVLYMLALLGQSTTLYAGSNVGKTLLTLWMLVELIKLGRLDGSRIMYVNADDDGPGLVFKAELAKKHGFHMCAPGRKNFEPAALQGYMRQMIDSGEAKDACLVLDTLKKFTNLMDKKLGSDFMNRVREFTSHGGSVIGLAHTNKNRTADGKPIYSGTTDVVDDCDCVYLLDIASTTKDVKRVVFDNIKRRGNVVQSMAFTYSDFEGITYQERFDSIKREDKAQTAQALTDVIASVKREKDQPIIEAIRQSILEGNSELKDIVERAWELSTASKRNITRVLHRYTGDVWGQLIGSKGKKTFQLISNKRPC